MKKVIISSLIAGFIMMSSIAYGEADLECERDDFVDGCVAGNSGGYRLLKVHKISLDGGKDTTIELSSVFSGKTTYLLTACTGGPNMIVTIYDRKHKKIISSYSERKDKYYPSITFKCKAAGIYYLKYEFEQASAGCGVGVVGFKR